MSNGMDLKELQDIVTEKENDWRTATLMQIKTLQKELSTTSENYNDIKEKFLKMKDDFKYNLKLLNERDDELKELDRFRQHTKCLESKYLCEISDLQIRADDSKVELVKEKKAKEEMEQFYKQKIADQIAQFEAFRTSKLTEVERVVSDSSKVKQHLELKIHQLESEIESQKNDLTHHFEDLIRTSQLESNEKIEEARNKCLQLEMKNKVLEKEIEVGLEKQKACDKNAENALQQLSDLKRKLQQSEFDVNDISSVKNARIVELESQLNDMHELVNKQAKEFDEHRSKLDKDSRVKQANFLSVQQSYLESESKLKEKIRLLSCNLDSTQVEIKRAIWDANNEKHEFKETLLAKDKEIEELKSKLETLLSDRSHSEAAKQTEIFTLQKQCNILKTQNARMTCDIEDYQQKLVKSYAKEQSLEESKARMESDCLRKFEEVKTNALANELSVQNEQLKNTIKQMRVEMQRLLDEQADRLSESKKTEDEKTEESTIAHPYVNSLENEVITLKKAKRDLENELTTFKSTSETEQKELKAEMQKVRVDLEHQKTLVTNSQNVASQLLTQIQQLKSEASLVPSQTKMTTKLQVEMVQLRRDLALAEQQVTLLSVDKPTLHSLVLQIDDRLKAAANKIETLTVERDQLLECGNRMRSELREATEQMEAAALTKDDEPVKLQAPEKKIQEILEKITRDQEADKLHQMEDLQYQLTKQELQFARRQPPPSFHMHGNRDSVSSSSEITDASNVESAQFPDAEERVRILPTRVPFHPVEISSSSLDDTSLKEVWNVLQQSPMTSIDTQATVNPVLQKGKSKPLEKPFVVHKYKPEVNKKRTSKPLKIRNYNIKDDTHFQKKSNG